MRAAVSTERIERRSDIPTCISTRSPAWCPCESLIRFRPSMSIRSRPNGSLVALVDVEQVRELALERAQVPEAGERVGVRLRLELARARLDVRLHRLGLDRRDGLDELLDSLGEPHGVVLEVLPERVQEHGLERGDVARHVGRARLAAAAAQRRRATRRAPPAPSSRLYGSPSPSAIAPTMPADQLRQLARDLLGGKLADLVERRTLDQPDEPLLRKLVARALEARERSPDAASLRSIVPSETADRGQDFGEDCARERPDHDRRRPASASSTPSPG